ncbi:MAG: WD40 repeat domain-containing protein, partial [Armatimonadetes bacterium]|nr:WD40 repeat domain-containing protein [Armatimonadota bacterium]
KSTASFVVGAGPVLGIYDVPAPGGAGSTMIITLDADGHLKMWGTDGTSMFDIPTGDTGIKCMSGNFKLQLIYTGDTAGLVHYYGETGQGAYIGTQGSAITCMTAARDGKTVITGGADGSIKVWDAMTHKVLTTIAAAHPGGVTALMVSPDGQMLVSGGADKQARAWTMSGDPIKSVAIGGGAITYLAPQVDVATASGK